MGAIALGSADGTSLTIDTVTPRDDVSAFLLEIAVAVDSARTFRRLLKVLAQKTARLCDVDRCSILLWCKDSLLPGMSQFASDGPRRAMWRSFKRLGPCSLDEIPEFAAVLKTGRPIVVDHSSGGLLPRQWIETFGVHSLAALPLLTRGRLVGIIVLDNCLRAEPIDESKIDRVRAVASHVALAIDNIRLLEEVRTRLRESETLLKGAQVIGSTLDLQEVARRIVREAALALGADTAGIYFEEDGALRALAGYRVPKHLLGPMSRARPKVAEFEHLTTFLDEAGPTVWSDDVATDPLFRHEIFRRVPVQSILLTRLRARDERVGLLVCAWWNKRRRPAPAEVRLIEGIAAQAAIGIVNARLYAEAEAAAVNRERMRFDAALHDTLSQTLFSIALQVDWCLRFGRRPRQLRSKLQDIKRDTALMMTQVRQLLSSVSPPSLPVAGSRRDASAATLPASAQD